MPNLSDKSIKDKIEKLVTAIFMVTDYMESGEPIRAKLRSMCLEMLSSAHALNHARTIVAKNEIIALVNVSKTIGLISQMNADILLRELNKSRDFIEQNFMINLEKLEMGREEPLVKPAMPTPKDPVKNLLSDINNLLSDKPIKVIKDKSIQNDRNDIRKQSILNTIRIKKSATINDIRMSVKDVSEKTIQRDLLSLMNDGLVKKDGEKRWSRYSVK